MDSKVEFTMALDRLFGREPDPMDLAWLVGIMEQALNDDDKLTTFEEARTLLTRLIHERLDG